MVAAARAVAKYLATASTLLPALAFAQAELHSFLPESGYVPDAKTAIQIAVAVWGPIYGEKQIASEAPFRARLKDGTWLVEGSLPDGEAGGVASAEISRRTGQILRVSHGQ